jgi:predicted lipid-binding transport protein (Tim44 family)
MADATLAELIRWGKDNAVVEEKGWKGSFLFSPGFIIAMLLLVIAIILFVVWWIMRKKAPESAKAAETKPTKAVPDPRKEKVEYRTRDGKVVSPNSVKD